MAEKLWSGRRASLSHLRVRGSSVGSKAIGQEGKSVRSNNKLLSYRVNQVIEFVGILELGKKEKK